MRRTVLVTGATGMIGPGVIGALRLAGWDVRVLLRAGGRVPEFCSASTGDMTDAQSLKTACRGVAYVVHMAARKNDEADSVAVNVDGARNLGAAAKHEGVQGIIHLSTQSVRLTDRGTYGQTKLDAERALDASGVPTVHLRASVVYGDGNEGIVGSIIGFSRLPVVPVIGDGSPRFRPIHRDDLGAIIASLLQQEMHRATFDVGGSEEYSFDALVRTILASRGIRRPLVHIPVVVALPIARGLRACLSSSPVTVSNVLGGAEDLPFDPLPILKITGVQPRSFRAAMAVTADALNVRQAEAKAFLSYVGYACGLPQPHSDLLGRYTSACVAHGVDLFPSFNRPPGRWRLLAHDMASRINNPEGPLRKKLLIAAAIRETDTDTQALLPERRPLSAIAVALLRVGIACVCAAPLALLFLIIHDRR